MAKTIAQLEESEQYVLLSGRLYRYGPDKVLQLCLNPEHYVDTIAEAHVSIGGIHASETQTVQRILLNGFWWPTLNEDVVHFVQSCSKCQTKSPIQHATLFSITITPRWSSHIVEYLQKGHTNSSKPAHRKRLIESETEHYTMISDQLYR